MQTDPENNSTGLGYFCGLPLEKSIFSIAIFYIAREARTELGAERVVKSTMVSNMVQVHRSGGRGSEIFTCAHIVHTKIIEKFNL